MTITETEPKVQASFEFKRLTPKGFDNPPETPLEALLQAQAVLFDEERWVKSRWYANAHPEVDPEDPFCNDWKVCAAGAVLMVTVGAARQLSRVKYTTDDDWRMVEVPLAQPGGWCTLWPDDLGHSGPTRGDKPEYDLYDQAVEFLTQGTTGLGGKSWRWSDVPAFNDAPSTTRQDVLKAFSKGIALAAKAEASSEVEANVKARIRAALEVV